MKILWLSHIYPIIHPQNAVQNYRKIVQVYNITYWDLEIILVIFVIFLFHSQMTVAVFCTNNIINLFILWHNRMINPFTVALWSILYSITVHYKEALLVVPNPDINIIEKIKECSQKNSIIYRTGNCTYSLLRSGHHFFQNSFKILIFPLGLKQKGFLLTVSAMSPLSTMATIL